MSDVFMKFDQRLGRIERTRRKLSSGYVAELGTDGLITIKPKRSKRGFPILGIALLVVGFFVFKAIMLAHLGPVSYGERVGKLEAGTQIEQAGAYVMQADPATTLIAGQIGPLLR